MKSFPTPGRPHPAYSRAQSIHQGGLDQAAFSAHDYGAAAGIPSSDIQQQIADLLAADARKNAVQAGPSRACSCYSSPASHPGSTSPIQADFCTRSESVPRSDVTPPQPLGSAPDNYSLRPPPSNPSYHPAAVSPPTGPCSSPRGPQQFDFHFLESPTGPSSGTDNRLTSPNSP